MEELWSVSKDKLRNMLPKSLVETGLNWYMLPLDALKATQRTQSLNRFIFESRELYQISLLALCVIPYL